MGVLMVQIARIIGGAGTGKTTELLRLMEINIRNGIDPFQIGFVSFTRAARAEAASRAGAAFNHKATDLERAGWFRTLHSICYKQLGIGAELITDNVESKSWISEALDEPVSGASLAGEDQTELSGAFDGQPTDADRSLGLWGLSRSTMEPLADVVERVKLFDWQCPEYEDVCRVVRKYEMAKRVHGRCDFTDILGRFAGVRFSIEGHDEEGYEDGEVPDVPVWFLDEQQDTSALLDKVCRRLVEPARFAYVVLDPFQAIYSFSGSSSRHAMAWDVQKEKVLPKSHRCPKNILELGEDILRQSSDYWDRKIQPNGPGGEIERMPFGCGWADEINPNDDWLLIARTNWQAKRMAGFLKDRNIPWIPTRGNGGWLECHRTKATQALIDLQAGLYVMDYDWKHIVETLPTKVSDVELLVRGTKTIWKKRETSSPKVEEEQNARWVDGLTEWGATPALIERVKTGRWSHLIKNGDEHVEAFKQWGRDAVMKPKVRVGTIHSVKGAQAMNVALLTTTSQKTAMTIDNPPEQADEEHRIGYVAVTRCRKRLLILDEKTPFQMLIP